MKSLVSSTELMKSLAACREHRLSGSSLNPSGQEALSAPATEGCQYSYPQALVAGQAFVGCLEDMSLNIPWLCRERCS